MLALAAFGAGVLGPSLLMACAKSSTLPGASNKGGVRVARSSDRKYVSPATLLASIDASSVSVSRVEPDGRKLMVSHGMRIIRLAVDYCLPMNGHRRTSDRGDPTHPRHLLSLPLRRSIRPNRKRSRFGDRLSAMPPSLRLKEWIEGRADTRPVPAAGAHARKERPGARVRGPLASRIASGRP